MQLKRTLGLAGLTFYGLGIILGAGIYSVLGAAAGLAGSAPWIAFALSGGVAFLTALSYAELVTIQPETSAEYAYLRRALPEWPGLALTTGLLVALSGAATTATVAIAFAGYFRTFVDLPPALVAWSAIAAALGLNILGIRESGWVNTVFTVIEASGLVFLIVLGATSGAFSKALTAAPNLGVMSGAALVFFAFLGFENVANLAEEAKEPERDLPRAIFLSLGLSAAPRSSPWQTRPWSPCWLRAASSLVSRGRVRSRKLSPRCYRGAGPTGRPRFSSRLSLRLSSLSARSACWRACLRSRRSWRSQA
ncbi:MAG: APC family permease [Myxococcales bacterium]|nr:APC family permease [Myxococcales bacterium]